MFHSLCSDSDWVTVQFRKSVFQATEVTIQQRTGLCRILKWALEGSIDNLTWRTLHCHSNWSDCEPSKVITSSTNQFRFFSFFRIRQLCTRCCGGTCLNFAQLEFLTINILEGTCPLCVPSFSSFLFFLLFVSSLCFDPLLSPIPFFDSQPNSVFLSKGNKNRL
jgi:hypothetical protein